MGVWLSSGRAIHASLHSLAALDAEFVGSGSHWPHIVRALAAAAWHRAIGMAQAFLGQLQSGREFSEGFQPCLALLAARISEAGERIARMA
jgi:hypothetical protein